MIQWVYNGYNRDCLQCMADPSQGVVETHFPWGNRVLALVLAKAIHANQDKSNAVLVSKHIKTYQNCSACNSFDPLEVKLEHINLWTSTSPEGRIPFSPVCECVCQMYTMCVCVCVTTSEATLNILVVVHHGIQRTAANILEILGNILSWMSPLPCWGCFKKCGLFRKASEAVLSRLSLCVPRCFSSVQSQCVAN